MIESEEFIVSLPIELLFFNITDMCIMKNAGNINRKSNICLASIS